MPQPSESIVRDLNRMLRQAGHDAAEIAAALGLIARNYGMSKLARDTGLSRESLYKTLSGTRSPEFSTILKILSALDLNLTVQPKDRSSS